MRGAHVIAHRKKALEKKASPEAEGLQALNRRVAEDLRYLAYPSRPWVPAREHPSGRPVHNVVVVGGGQVGVAVAFALRQACVDRVLVIDRAREGLEGPWITFARMATLRTRKELIGLENGVASLTFRAWFEARFGEAAWDALGKIPRTLWMEYLVWFRQVLGIAVENETSLGRIEPEGDVFKLSLFRRGGEETVFARKVVLATGIEGSGGRNIPDAVAALPRDRYAHTADDIDFAALKGKRVGVLGAGASAFDNAAVALEEGAAEVHQFVRRPSLPNISYYRWMDFSGFLEHFAALDDARKWEMMAVVFRETTPPPKESVARVEAFKNFHIHLGAPWESTRMKDGLVEVATPKGRFTFDFLILGTGFKCNFAARPELVPFAHHIACWRDRYAPPLGAENAKLAGFPYLGSAFEFTERAAGEAPYLRNIHFLNPPSTLSLGPTGRVNGMKYGIPRLVSGIARDFFLADADGFAASLKAFRYDDYPGHPWFGQEDREIGMAATGKGRGPGKR